MIAIQAGPFREPNLKIFSIGNGLAAADTLIYFLSFYLASWLYSQLQPAWSPASVQGVFFCAAVFAGVTAITMCSMGLYEPRLRERPQGILTRMLGAFILMGLVMSLLILVTPALEHWRGAFIYSALLAFFGSLAARVISSQATDLNRLKRRVVVLGTGYRASHIAKRMRRKSDRHGFQIVGYITFPGENISGEFANLDIHNQSLSAYVKDHDIQEVVLALDDPCQTMPEQELLLCRKQGVSVLSMMEFFEQEASKVLLDEASAEWFLFSGGSWRKALGAFGKRTFDIASSLMLLILSWPLMLLTMIAIKLEDGIRAPVFFHQKRVGLNGRIFHVMKFRSMTVNAEADGKARWATMDDARVTRVGRLIRAVRIDELPQIVNVLAGDMAFVGPRPERPEFVSELVKDIPFFEKRHVVKPGITGWAQLNYPYGASVKDAVCKLEFDLYYVKNQSLLLDFLVLLQTIEVILFRKGAR